MKQKKTAEDLVHVFLLPSLDRGKDRINSIERDGIFETIMDKLNSVNGNSDYILCEGTYFKHLIGSSFDDSIVRIESRGINPFSESEIRDFEEIFRQKIIIKQMSTGLIKYLKAHLTEKDAFPKEFTYTDGTILKLDKSGEDYKLTEVLGENDKTNNFCIFSIDIPEEAYQEGIPDEILQEQMEQVQEAKKSGILDDEPFGIA